MAAGAAELLELVVGPEGDSSFRGTNVVIFPNKCGPIVSYDGMDAKESCDGFDSRETGLQWAQSQKALGCFCGDNCAGGSRNEFGLGPNPRFNCFRSGCRDD